MTSQVITNHHIMTKNKIDDIFSVVQNDVKNDIKNNSISSINYLDTIMTQNDITKLKINWTEILHTFYEYQLVFNDDVKNIILEKINFILLDIINKSSLNNNTNTNKEINHLNRFLHLNALFEILNELNSSYNQTIDYKNYTLKMCQNLYLSIFNLNNNSKIIDHWFDGIYNGINLELFDGKHKSKYHKGIDLLKKYLIRLDKNSIHIDNTEQNNNISEFICKYSNWISNTLINNFNENKMTLSEIFIKLNNLNDINKLFIDDIELRSKFLMLSITQLVPCWKVYLSQVLINNFTIDENIMNAFNSVDLSLTNYHNYTIEFMESWYSNIKLNIGPKYYGNSKLFESLRKICPLITNFINGHNKSNLIIKYIKDLYLVDSNLLGYIMTGLNILIKTNKSYELNSDIKYALILISLYDNKDELWNLYFSNTYKRITTMTKKIRLNKNLINYEFDIFEQLLANGCVSCSDKTKSLLNNFKNSINHINIIHKLKINYINESDNDTSFNGPDVSKVDYTIFDKYIWECENNNNNIKYCLIEENKYPKEILAYLSIGKSYFDIISETNKIDWDTENSIINYNIGKINLISNIIQYTIISTIINASKTINGCTKQQLINHIVIKDTQQQQLQHIRAKEYLESYISYMISKDIIVLSNGKLLINMNFYNNETETMQLDISDFVPSLYENNKQNKQIKSTNSIDSDISNTLTNTNEDINMTSECLSYLRLMMLIKMFKENSTTIFPLNTITNRLSEQIDKYISINKNIKLNLPLKLVFDNLVNISDNQLIMELKSLEKRDIIEECKKKSSPGYIYVI